MTGSGVLRSIASAQKTLEDVAHSMEALADAPATAKPETESVVKGALRLLAHATESLHEARRLADQERARVAAIMDTAPEAMVVVDDQARVTYANPAAEALFAASVAPGEPWFRPAHCTIHRSDGTPWNERNLPLTRAALDGESCKGIEMILQEPKGERHHLLVNTAPLMANGAQLRGAVGLYRDVTEMADDRRKLSRSFRRSELMRDIVAAILVGSKAEEIVGPVLPKVRELTGCSRASVALLDRQDGTFSILGESTLHESRLHKGWRCSLHDTYPDEGFLRTEAFMVDDLQEISTTSPLLGALQEEGIRGYVSVPIVVRDEVIGSLDLGMEESGELASELLDLMCAVANQIGVGLYQAHLSEELERHRETLEQRVHNRTAQLNRINRRLVTIWELAPVGIARVDGGGTILDCNPAFRRLVGSGQADLRGVNIQGILRGEGRTEIWNLLNRPPTDDGREVKRELRLVTRSGEQRRAAVSISSSATGRNSLPSSVVVVQDITAEKEAEAVIARAHKADLAGRMASVLGHELNNPLQAILGCIGLAREGLVQGEDVEEYLDVALSELQRVKRIMDQLRHLQPVSVTGKREEVEISGLIARTVTLVSNLGREQGVEIIWHAEPGLPLIKVVADEVHQVLLNLALNALEAMPEGGHLTVRASMDVSGHGVNIQFSDTGPGMASSDLSELFEPFRSSKQGGLGLGLFIVHNIVDKYAGRITVESDLGSGTTFTVWLPI